MISPLRLKQNFAACKTFLPILVLVLVLGICSTTEAAKTQLKNGTFPALIAFGDSILDTGNNNNIRTVAKCNFPPYGINFIGRKPTGRFSNGKILTDLIADGLGIKEIVPAYLDRNLHSNDLPTGVCFASGGSGLDPVTSSLLSVVSPSAQLKNFKDYLRKLQDVVGQEKANNIISDSLFILSFGNNDIAFTYFKTPSRALTYNFDSYANQLVSWTSSFLQELYRLGVRKVAVFSTLPLGCLPGARTLLGGTMRVCAENENVAAKSFNSKLVEKINKLSLPQAKIIYVDVYNPLLELIKNPAASGFKVPDKGCCGSGRLEAGISCNQFFSSTCSDPSQYVFWDSVHPSEKAYKVLASQILQQINNNF